MMENIGNQGRVKRFALTDLGNAERLVSRYGRGIRYCAPTHTWYLWDGNRWRADDTNMVQRLAQAVARLIPEEASSCKDAETRKSIIRWAKRSESDRSKIAMINQATSLEGVPVLPNDFDKDPDLLNTQNGTINLRTAQVTNHRRENLITRVTATDYRPDASHPSWNQFLETVTGENKEKREFLQRAIGCSLIGGNREERLFFVYGGTATGKSTFLGFIRAALGDYVSTVDSAAFATRLDPGAARGELVNAQGSRIVMSSEVENGMQIARGILKNVTGRDVISVRRNYQDAIEMRPTYTPWLVANQPPRFPSEDDAVWRRVVCIPFDHTIPESERDPSLKETLQEDPAFLRAVLSWCVNGVEMYLEDGLNPPEIVRNATARLRDEVDPVSEFIGDRCVLAADRTAKPGDLCQAYGEWAQANGHRPLSQKNLGISLKRHGCEAKRGAQGRFWQGIGLRQPGEA
ncbi:MAG TPA: phage/plasmid primase, P4 family [Candidatus Latescibacteria bacterium]|mgnify:FL=1|nr:phage/plasmid primase, P4 family [Candidatus Latescibacterota bacterium]HPK75652.1 phage/plasmid primase, P4 family [Candidatus Latescibacterota bacterium]